MSGDRVHTGEVSATSTSLLLSAKALRVVKVQAEGGSVLNRLYIGYIW